MASKKIVHLAKLDISKSDREALGERDLGFLSAIAFSVNEISVFQKLYIQSLNAKPESEDLHLPYTIQINTIARVLSAKVLESIKLYRDYIKVLERAGDRDSVEALKPHSDRLEVISASDSFEIAVMLRNDATNHYLLHAARQNIEVVPDRGSFFALLHEMHGNSFYPFGEEIVFMGRIGRFFQEAHGRNAAQEDIQAWSDWIKCRIPCDYTVAS